MKQLFELSLAMVNMMNATETSANETEPWYLGFDPIYERTYSVKSNNELKKVTERLQPDEVSDLLVSALNDEQLVGDVRRYIDYTTSRTNEKSNEEDAELHGRIVRFFVDALSEKDIPSGHFFATSLALSAIQAIHSSGGSK